MAKRRASDNLKTPKNEELQQDSDQDEDEYDDVYQAEADDTKIEPGQATYEPDQLRILVESFLEFVHAKQSQTTSVFNMERLVSEWAETRPDDCIDVSLFCADYRKYLKTALKIRNFQLNDASSALLTYLGSEKALPDFKAFPSKLPSRIHLYIKKKKLPHKPNDMGNAYKNMREDNSGAIEEVNEEIRVASLKYIPDLQDFLEIHPNLTPAQKRAVEVKITRAQKMHGTKDTSQKTPRKKPKKEIETPYSLWCRAKAEKYRDLSEEEREKKLQKKFAKITDAERTLLEQLVLSQ